MELGEHIYEDEKFLFFNIWVTIDCNYQCTYCYEAGKKENLYMGEDVATQVIKFILEMCDDKKRKTLWLNFHGGEPMLNSKIIKYIINGIKSMRGDVKIYTSMTTNCSIYEQDICQYINEITVSIDGSEKTHDTNRRQKNGGGTYEKSIYNALKYLKEKKEVRLRMVVTPNNVQSLYENIIYLYNLGFKKIIPGLDYYDSTWNEELFEELFKQMKKVQEYRDTYTTDDLMVGIIDETIQEKGKCVVGCDGYQISVDGILYPCILVVQQQEYDIGDIYNGLNDEAIERINRLNCREVEECKGCNNYDYCISSRCLLLNNQLTGNYYMPSAIICALERVKLRLQGFLI